MQLYIMRHGQAETFGNDDASRPLTEEGKLEVAVMAKWLHSTEIEFDHLFVSPFLRAQQTAKILLAALNISLPQTTLGLITPEGNAQKVHDYIDGVCSVERFDKLLIVSHMPLVSFLTAELTVEQESPIFQTAAIAQIDYNLKRMKGHLTRLVSPHDLC